MVDGKHEAANKHAFLSNSTYDLMKFVALILLPAVGALYFGVAEIWGLPKAQEVVGTIVVVDTFLGALLGISKQRYDGSDEKYSGVVYVTPDETQGTTGVNVQLDPDALAVKDEVVVKVKHLS